MAWSEREDKFYTQKEYKGAIKNIYLSAEKAIQALIDSEAKKAVERKVKRRIDECSYCGNRVYPMVFHEKCSHSDYRADLWKKIEKYCRENIVSVSKTNGTTSLEQDIKEILNIKE
jgi:hypothetical protein